MELHDGLEGFRNKFREFVYFMQKNMITEIRINDPYVTNTRFDIMFENNMMTISGTSSEYLPYSYLSIEFKCTDAIKNCFSAISTRL